MLVEATLETVPPPLRLFRSMLPICAPTRQVVIVIEPIRYQGTFQFRMEYLLFVGVVQALFTTVFLASKRSCSLSDRILAIWMVFIALPMMGGVAARLWPGTSISILNADLIYPLTYGSFMWLYVRGLTGANDRLTHRDLLHFLPFFAVSTVQFVTGWTPPPPNPENTVFDNSTRAVGALNFVLMLTYSLVAANRLRRHGTEIRQHFSNLPNRITLIWLLWLTAGFSAVSLLLFLASLLVLPDLMRIHLPAQITIILAMSFFGLRQGQVFDPQTDHTRQDNRADHKAELVEADRTKHSVLSSTSDDVKTAYSRSGLSEDRAKRISEKLGNFMETERPYLLADLTIANLAKKMSVPRHHLTEVINMRHHKSFYLFVNEYRIEAVKQAMQDPANADQTLLDLAYANGFNSKSTFNSAFKQLTAVTPSQYRRQLA